MTQPEPIDHYSVPDGSLDELLQNDGHARGHVEGLIASLQRLGPEALIAAGQRRDSIFMQQGITFEVYTEDGNRRDRPFPLDLVPRVLTSEEWTVIKRGLAQRIRALNAFVDDIYHQREIVRAGKVPWSLIVSRPSFARPVHGIRAPGGVYTHVSGCDLVRGGDGIWRVLEDNVRTPSGISYVLENRVAMTRLMPELFAGHRVRPVSHYPNLLLEALKAVAPAADTEPTVVVWTPGSLNSAYFEHAFLAREMGIELVEASDLVVRDSTVYMRTTAGLQRVHTIYRRLDDDFIDPLEFRPDSMLGVPGLIRAYRAGTVAIANAVGTGVADDKAIYHFVPEMVRFYLGEEPILENVQTYFVADDATRKMVKERLSELVVKPTSESGGKGVFIGPRASEAELEEQRRIIEAEPERYIAQELVHLSTVPTEIGGELSPRHVDLRPFAVFGEEIRIVPGGLTRVAMREGSMIVNSSQGGGSKDTWVLDDGAGTELTAGGALPPRQPPRLPDIRYGGWHGQAQQQQQSSPSAGLPTVGSAAPSGAAGDPRDPDRPLPLSAERQRERASRPRGGAGRFSSPQRKENDTPPAERG